MWERPVWSNSIPGIALVDGLRTYGANCISEQVLGSGTVAFVFKQTLHIITDAIGIVLNHILDVTTRGALVFNQILDITITGAAPFFNQCREIITVLATVAVASGQALDVTTRGALGLSQTLDIITGVAVCSSQCREITTALTTVAVSISQARDVGTGGAPICGISTITCQTIRCQRWQEIVAESALGVFTLSN